jgi:hypothetical protein
MKLKSVFSLLAVIAVFSSTAFPEPNSNPTKFNQAPITLNLSQISELLDNKKAYYKTSIPSGETYKIPKIKIDGYFKNAGRVRFEFNKRRLNNWPGTEDGSMAFLRGIAKTSEGNFISAATLYKTEAGFYVNIYLTAKRPFRARPRLYTITIDYKKSDKNKVMAKALQAGPPANMEGDDIIGLNVKATVTGEGFRLARSLKTAADTEGPRYVELGVYADAAATRSRKDISKTMLGIINSAEAVTYADLNVGIVVLSTTAWETNPAGYIPGTDANNLAFSFADYLAKTPHDYADTHMIFTGSPYSRIVGLAYGGMCSNGASFLVYLKYDYPVAVFIHEIAHVLGANHVDGQNVMNPICYGDTNIVQTTKDQVEASIKIYGSCLYDISTGATPTPHPTPPPTSTPDPNAPTPTATSTPVVSPTPTPLHAVFIKDLSDVYTKSNLAVGFAVDINDTYSGTIDWFKNDVVIPGEHTNLLYLFPNTFKDGDRIQVKVSGKLGTYYSSVAVIHVGTSN